eukprot:14720198-Alexandrium_andersonii.AAC.1
MGGWAVAPLEVGATRRARSSTSSIDLLAVTSSLGWRWEVALSDFASLSDHACLRATAVFLPRRRGSAHRPPSAPSPRKLSWTSGV